MQGCTKVYKDMEGPMGPCNLLHQFISLVPQLNAPGSSRMQECQGINGKEGI